MPLQIIYNVDTVKQKDNIKYPATGKKKTDVVPLADDGGRYLWFLMKHL